MVVVLCTEDDGPVYRFEILGVLEPNGRAPFTFLTEPMLPGSFEVVAYAIPATEADRTSQGFELIVQEIEYSESTSAGQPVVVVDFRATNFSEETVVDVRLWVTLYDDSGGIIGAVAVPLTAQVPPGSTLGSTVTIPIQGAMPEGFEAVVRIVGFTVPLSGPPADEQTPIDSEA